LNIINIYENFTTFTSINNIGKYFYIFFNALQKYILYIGLAGRSKILAEYKSEK